MEPHGFIVLGIDLKAHDEEGLKESAFELLVPCLLLIFLVCFVIRFSLKRLVPFGIWSQFI